MEHTHTEEKIITMVSLTYAWKFLLMPDTPCDGPFHNDTNPAHNALHATMQLCAFLNCMTIEEQEELFSREQGLKEFFEGFNFIKPFIKVKP
jgi:hypothetical protein